MAEDSMILAVRREVLFGGNGDYFQGFREAGEVDYEARILERPEWVRRGDVEEDPRFKQPIPYAMVVNPSLGQVFAFKRAKKVEGKYDEARLQGKWSWGVGGHVEPSDQAENILTAGFLRELGEEVTIHGDVRKVRNIGCINDDSNPVGQVHFSLLYVVETNATLITPKDPEIAEGRLRDVQDLSQLCKIPEFQAENWSRIAVAPLIAYLRQAS
ncbi:hypothetical protein A3K73_08360 [Candidatus Pacearchaeota archaeon RBG_13_36_9]|nr:MAG: hypothetical protein A3K73_08360 [Candidatus Pacearchaeota archaeon RBG_13_36_9]